MLTFTWYRSSMSYSYEISLGKVPRLGLGIRRCNGGKSYPPEGQETSDRCQVSGLWIVNGR